MTATLQFLAIFAALLGLAAIAACFIDPRAKDWAADIIARLAEFSVAELRARAMAQRAARTTWTATRAEALRQFDEGRVRGRRDATAWRIAAVICGGTLLVQAIARLVTR